MTNRPDPAPQDRATQIPIWAGPVEAEPLGGGLTNQNFLVTDNGKRYVARVGDDIPLHGIMRFNEQAASRAADAAGVSPAIVHTEPGVMVMEFIQGVTCEAEDIRDTARLPKIATLVKRAHNRMPQYLRGPLLSFWVFHIIRDYAGVLREAGSSHAMRLSDLLEMAQQLENAIGPVDLVFGHNDLLAANFVDDGHRVWLIDWDYAGFNSPLFDLANLSANNLLDADQEAWLLADYFGEGPTRGLLRRFHAMKCASLLREAMWSMVSEIHSQISFDFPGYTAKYLDRFDHDADVFKREYGGL